MTMTSEKARRSLTGKTIIFTGGSGYLGSAMVAHLLECGAIIINLGRRRPDIISKYPARGKHFTVDFYETEKLKRTLESVLTNLDAVHVLVNNTFDFSPKTGFNHPLGKLENITKDIFMQSMESGLYWTLLCSQIVGRKMIQKRQGNIINIASLYSFLVADYRIYKGRKIFNPVTYPIAKHGLLGLTRYIASFWSEHNIRCNCLSPGTFPNVQSKTSDPSAPNLVDDDEFLDILKGKCSLGRVGVPSDLLSALEFLCSDKSAYMTGSNLVVDGGWSVL